MFRVNCKKCVVLVLIMVLLQGVFTTGNVFASVFDDPMLRLDSVEVRPNNGYPALYINNAKTPAILFAQWTKSINDTFISKYPNYEGNAKYAGIHLYQIRADVGSSIEKLGPILDGILANDPKAYFQILIWVASPYEMWFTANASNEPNIDTTTPEHTSFGSEKWRQMSGLLVRQIVRDFNFSRFRDRVTGYLLTAGGTGEWFDPNIYSATDFDRSLANQIGFRNWLKSKYTTDASLRTAWNNSSVSLDTATIPAKISSGPFIDCNMNQSLIDFMEYDSLTVAKSIEYLCSVIKDETNNKRIAGVFYGYTMETGKFGNTSGSLAFHYLLHSPYVDYFASPLAYHHRNPYGDGYVDGYAGWHGFADSCRAHGKLWLSEDDTPTHVCWKPEDEWYKIPTNENQSKAVLWKDFMAALTKGFGHWWYDNSGTGNVNTPGLIYQVALMNSLAEAANSKPQSNWTEVALIVDEKSQFYQTPTGSAFNEKLATFRTNLAKMGVPFDVLSMDDVVSGQAGTYKMYIFANAFALTTEQRTAIKNLRSSNKAFVWLKAPGVIDISTKAPSYTALQDITWLDLRLASQDTGANMTEVPLSNLYSGFTNNNPPHMFAIPNPQDSVIATSSNGKCTVIKSNKGTWLSYFADDIDLLTPAILRNICTDASVHKYSLNNHFVSADNRFVSVTLPGGGSTEDIWFPMNGTVYEVISDTEYTVTGNKLTVDASSPRTYVFYYGTRDNLGMIRPTLPSNTPHHIDLARGETSSMKLYPSQTKRIDPDVMTTDNLDVAENYSVTWASDNSAVASVDSSGKVTGISVGTTTIRASAAGLSGSRTVEVVAANTFKSIRFSETNHAINKGSTYSPTLQIVHYDGTTEPLNSSLATWFSRDQAIARVDSAGVITGEYDGAVAIIAEYQGEKAVIGISVNDTANIPRDLWFANGGYVRFDSISGNYALKTNSVDKNLVESDETSTAVYASSNPAVAVVSSNGIITPVAPGVTLITASKYNKIAKCLVEVTRVEMEPMNITISTEMTVGQTNTPVITTKPQFWSVTNTWSVSSGTSVQVVNEGNSIYTASAGQSKVQGNIGFGYPRYNVFTNVMEGRTGQIRPIYTIDVN